MNTRLYKRLRDNIFEFANGNMSKNDFLNSLRTNIIENYPNRVIKWVDSSDTRMANINPHLPIMFVELDPQNDENKISYTFLVNVDKMGTKEALTPDLFIAALSYQLNNIDEITKCFLDELNITDFKEVNPDLESVWVVYLKKYAEMLKHLREQNQQDYAFGLLNGVVTTDLDLEMLIQRLHFDPAFDLNTDLIDVMASKYHLPTTLKPLIERVYKNYRRLIK